MTSIGPRVMILAVLALMLVLVLMTSVSVITQTGIGQRCTKEQIPSEEDD